MCLQPLLQCEAPTASTVELAKEVQLWCIRVARKDGMSDGNWAVHGMVVRIFSQRETMLFLTDKQMQTMIDEMKAYLRVWLFSIKRSAAPVHLAVFTRIAEPAKTGKTNLDLLIFL